MQWKCLSKIPIWRLIFPIKEIILKTQTKIMINNLHNQTTKIKEKNCRFQQIQSFQKCYSLNRRNHHSARWKTYNLFKSKSLNGFKSRFSSGWAKGTTKLERKIWWEKTEKSVDSMNNKKLMSFKRQKWMNSHI